MSGAIAVLEKVCGQFQSQKDNDGKVGTGTWVLLLLAVLSIGWAVFRASWERARANRLQMQIELVEHERKMQLLNDELDESREARVVRVSAIEAEDRKLEQSKAEVAKLRKRNEAFKASMDKVLSWDDLQVSSGS